MKYAVVVTALLTSVLITPAMALAGGWGDFLSGLGKGASDVADQHIKTREAAELERLRTELAIEREARIAENQRQRNIEANRQRLEEQAK